MSTRQRVIFFFMMLMVVAAWAIDQSTPQAGGVDFPVDHYTASTEGTKDIKDRLLLSGENFTERSASDFLTPEGRFDLKAIRASGYQGPLDLKGLDVGTDPRSGEPVLSPIANGRISVDPEDTLWSPLGSGMDQNVRALAVYDGKLIAGGVFTTAGGVSANCIASWGGSYWSPLGSGMNGSVFALAVYDGKLIAGGFFTTAGGVSADYTASWDGSSWSPLGSGMNDYVFALAVYDNRLIAGGYFTTAGGLPPPGA